MRVVGGGGMIKDGLEGEGGIVARKNSKSWW